MRLFPLMLCCLLGGWLLAGCAPSIPAGEVSRLQQELDLVRSAQQQLSRQQDDLRNQLAAVETQLQGQQQLVTRLRQTLTAPAPNTEGAGAAVAAANPLPPVAPAPTEIYLQAFADYASGRYPQAIAGFTSFLRIYPHNDYAANARYWLGESCFAQEQYPQAIEEFGRLVKDFPPGGKAPDALFKMVLAQQHLGLQDAAERTLQTLRQDYPDSPALQKALQAAKGAAVTGSGGI